LTSLVALPILRSLFRSGIDIVGHRGGIVMNIRGVASILGTLLLIGCASVPAPAYRQAGPETRVVLPRDLAGHDDFRTEWWYYTGNLTDESGHRYSYQTVFFKRRTDLDTWLGMPVSAFSNPSHMAHFCLTDQETGRFVVGERTNQDYQNKKGQAGARTDALYVWNGDWSVKEIDGDHLITAKTKGISVSFLLTPRKPYVIHGSDGFFVKAEGGRASDYISSTRMSTDGVLTIDGVPHRVKGLSWHDHEYGTRMMSPDQVGWDWFSIQLDDGSDLMLYLFRRADGAYTPFSGGTLVDPKGEPLYLGLDDIRVNKLRTWESPQTGARYPVEFDVELPRFELKLHMRAGQDNQEVQTPHSTRTTYWEGATVITGSYAGKAVTGVGFLEMCGYTEPFKFLSRAGQSEIRP
jgi:predicted secreted hydrolase